jgi:hypothetical protein
VEITRGAENIRSGMGEDFSCMDGILASSQPQADAWG